MNVFNHWKTLLNSSKTHTNSKKDNYLPGLNSGLLLRPPHNRTLLMRTRICFWQRDLLLFWQTLRLLGCGRLAESSLTARFCRIRELARAAIFPPSHLWEGGLFWPHTPLLVRSSHRSPRKRQTPLVRVVRGSRQSLKQVGFPQSRIR